MTVFNICRNFSIIIVTFGLHRLGVETVFLVVPLSVSV